MNGSVYEDLRNGSYLNVFVKWVEKVSKLRYERFSVNRNITTSVTTSFQKQFNKLLQEGRTREFFLSSDSIANVKNKLGTKNHQVDLSLMTCTCGYFWEYGKPCLHAARAIDELELDYLSFVHPAYHAYSLQSMYQVTHTLTTRHCVFY